MNRSARFFSLAALIALVVAFVPHVSAQSTVNLVLDGFSSGTVETNTLQGIVDSWNKANPGIQVKYIVEPDYGTTLNKNLASGSLPDIFYVDSSLFLQLVSAGALLPVGDQIDNANDFIPALKDVFTANGKFYCPPKDFSTLALQVNNDMLKAANISAPPKTWDEFTADAKALTTKDVAGTITPNDPARWLAFLYQAGGTLTDANFTKMTVNSPEGLAALKFYTDLYANGYAKKPSDVGAGWPGEAFEKGKAAMIFEGNWLIGDAKNNAPKLNYSSVPLPAGPKGQASMVFTVCYGVAAQGKHTAEATKFLNYLVSPDSMKTFTEAVGVMPARQSLAADWLTKYPDLKVYLDSAQYAHRWAFPAGFQPVLDDISKQIDLVFQGQETPEDALKEIETTGNAVLAKNAAGASATAAATMGATMAPTMAATASS